MTFVVNRSFFILHFPFSIQKSRPTYYAAERAAPAMRARAAEILAEGAGTVVALEAALALRLDPGCVPALADPTAARTERTPRRLLGWLRRRRSA